MTPAAFSTAVGALSLDTAPYFAFAAIAVTAIASIWAVKKVIKLGNRS